MYDMLPEHEYSFRSLSWTRRLRHSLFELTEGECFSKWGKVFSFAEVRETVDRFFAETTMDFGTEREAYLVIARQVTDWLCGDYGMVKRKANNYNVACGEVAYAAIHRCFAGCHDITMVGEWPTWRLEVELDTMQDRGDYGMFFTAESEALAFDWALDALVKRDEGVPMFRNWTLKKLSLITRNGHTDPFDDGEDRTEAFRAFVGGITEL